jgi:hypothetical protein
VQVVQQQSVATWIGMSDRVQQVNSFSPKMAAELAAKVSAEATRMARADRCAEVGQFGGLAPVSGHGGGGLCLKVVLVFSGGC